MRIALIGYGNVGRAFSNLLKRQHSSHPFRIAGIHTARHGTSYSDQPDFGPAAASVEEFLDRAKPDIVAEITTLNPATGEPAIAHIRAALARGRHVITANKGPIAHAYAALRDQAREARVKFRFESTVMDGVPVFNMVRNDLPGVKILGFTGVLNSTSKVVIEAMREGQSMQAGIEAARRLGITEADASYDTDPLAAVTGTSNLLLLHTDLMGTIGTMGVNCGVEQTAYGLFSDAVDIARGVQECPIMNLPMLPSNVRRQPG